LISRYENLYKASLENTEKFWDEAAKDVKWFKPYKKILDRSNPPFYRWFPDGVINSCYNAIDRHVDEGNGSRTAILYDSPVTSKKKLFSYLEAKKIISTFAGALKNFGINKGDRIIIYMPMIPEAVFAMLACARIGAVHSVVFGGFAANELAARINDSEAKLIISASCGFEPGRTIQYKPLLDEAIKLAKIKPKKCIIFQRENNFVELGANDISWSEFIKNSKEADCEPMNSNDPAYILYTSGTTGTPKGIVRDTGGHIVALKWSMKNIYNINPGDVWWSASDIGWVVGHSYIVYAPLFHGCTTIIYEGKPVGTPDAGSFWRVISEHKVKTLFTAPTAFRAIKKEDPEGKFFKKYDLSNFESLFLAGERADPDTIKWAENLLKKPVIDHWWQTETGWAISSNFAGLGLFKTKYGTFPTLWNADKRYKENYMDPYQGYYKTYDAGHIDEEGYIWIMSRTDDIINVAGHRLSTGSMEEILSENNSVAECAVLGIADNLKGQIPLGLIVLKSGVSKKPEEITKECIQMVREKIGPVAAFKNIVIVKRLPKTRSGKILRGTVSKIADQVPYKMPATIDDPAILDEIKSSLITAGIIKN